MPKHKISNRFDNTGINKNLKGKILDSTMNEMPRANYAPYEDPLDVIKDDIRSYNYSCLDRKHPFELFTKTSTNTDNLQRIYDTYNKVVTQVKRPNEIASILLKPLTNYEELLQTPYSPLMGGSHNFSRRKNKYKASPYIVNLNANKRMKNKMKINKSNANSVRKLASRMEDNQEVKDETTIIKGPLINTYNNYNNININNISIGQIKESTGIKKSILNNFRRKKYNLQGSNKHNLSFDY